jgi:hypothetical protein
MGDDLIGDTAYALDEAIAATLLAGWLLTCQRKSVISQTRIIELATKWLGNDGAAGQVLQNGGFGRWISPHLDQMVNATTPARQTSENVPGSPGGGMQPMQPGTE